MAEPIAHDTSIGCITLAVGRPMYVEMAVDLALSLRECGDPGLTLVVDRSLLAYARQYERWFDQICLLPDHYRIGKAMTYAVADLTPYARTLFIDADCLALTPIRAWFDLWSEVDFGVMAERLEADDPRLHHERRVRDWTQEFGLQSYLKVASAVFYFEREAGRQILGEVFNDYRQAYRAGRWLGDEVGFAIAAKRIDIGVLPHPWPILWEHDFDGLDVTRPRAPLFHAFSATPRPVLNALLQGVTLRRRVAGLPLRSEPFWRIKSSSAGKPSFWTNLRYRLAMRRLGDLT